MDSKPKVLYVDDEHFNLMLFENSFSGNYHVLTALSGYAGFEVLKENPDTKVVISDMKMPGMNGIEFIKAAKEQFPSVVFYILTGFDITDEIREALNKGLINKYFQKPFRMREIDAEIRKALKI